MNYKHHEVVSFLISLSAISVIIGIICLHIYLITSYIEYVSIEKCDDYQYATGIHTKYISTYDKCINDETKEVITTKTMNEVFK